MKIPILAFALMACVVNSLDAQQAAVTQVTQANVPAPTAYSVVKQDANSTVWQREEYEAGPNSQTITHLRHYTEIATGLNYKDSNGNWQPSKEEIDIQPDGTASATHSQHQVEFPADIANGSIKLVTPEGIQISSEPEELTYFDGTNAVILAQLTNSVGVLVSDNQIVYPNCFSGLKASLRYTVTKAGLEQDVILLQQPLTPEYYQLNADTARLQMVTEFFNPPSPSVANTALPNQAGLSLTDQSIGFGVMRLGSGRAFLLGQSAADPGAFVAKSWLSLDGRQFLVEEVPVNAIVNGLTTLPLTAHNGNLSRVKYLAFQELALPKHNNQPKSSSAKIITHGHLPQQGFVMDYQAINSSMTNVTFQKDTTYYLSGSCYLNGTNTFEGGAVLKYTNNATLDCAASSQQCTLNWLGGQYRPVIFTAKDDNSIGDTISGSTGNPNTNYYANPALSMNYMANNTIVNGFRISYAKQAVLLNAFAGGYTASFYNGQIVNSLAGFTADSGPEPAKLRNIVFANVATNFNNLYYGEFDVQNCTFSGSAYLMTMISYAQTTGLSITNCVFANVTNSQTSGPSGGTYWFNGDYNGFFNSYTFGNNTNCTSVYPFQTVGDGHYYLTNGCTFHNWGTTNIDPVLLAELPNVTTYPPIVYTTGTLSLPTTLSPYAQRDNTSNPDIGYHYAPLDYVFGGSDLYSSVTFSAGVAVGYHQASGGVYSSGQPYGLSLNNGASFTTVGTATAPCWVADFSDVQEGTGAWVDSGWMGALMLNGSSSSTIPQISATFTKWGKPVSFLFRDNWAYGEASFANCEFYADGCETYNTTYLYYTNCLLDRCEVYGFDQDIAPNFTMQNCTFYNGFLTFLRDTWQPPAFWKIINTSFDGTGFAFADQLNGTNTETLINFNSYNTNNLAGLSYSYPYATPTNVLEVVGPNDQKISGYNWQASWFGSFYLPPDSPLIEMGSTNANVLGLYHFTTQTNQTIDGNNIVDIGYHYVATDSNGNPLDSNSDGIPDYLEDANGNGLVDSGEIGWNINGDLGLQVWITRPRNGSVLP